MYIKSESKSISSVANPQESPGSLIKLGKYVDVSCILTNIQLGKKIDKTEWINNSNHSGYV